MMEGADTMATMKKDANYTIGIDYGSNSVRAVVADVRDGSEIGAAVFQYPSGDAGVLPTAKIRTWPGRTRWIFFWDWRPWSRAP